MRMWNEVTLSEDFEIKGHWRLPGDSTNTLAGTLSRKSLENELSLFGSFVPPEFPPRLERLKPLEKTPIILGDSSEGDKVTLHMCMPKNDESYDPKIVFVGDHYESTEQLVFKKMSFTVDQAEPWIGYIPIGVSEKDKEDSQKFSIAGRNMDDIVLNVPSIGKLRIAMELYGKGDRFKSLTFTQTARFVLEPEASQPFSWFTRNMDHVLHLLALLMGHPAYVANIAVVGENERERFVYFEPARKPEKKVEPLGPADFLIYVPAIRERLEEIFSKWFSGVEKLDEFMGLYFSTVYNRSFSVENQFITLMRSLECYSRAMDIPPPNPAKPRERFHLKQRLTAIMESLEAVTVKLFSSKPEDFRDKLVDVRDYRTHYFKEETADTLTGKPLYILSMRVELLIIILLLKLIGITEAEIRHVFEHHSMWMQFRYLHFDDKL